MRATSHVLMPGHEHHPCTVQHDAPPAHRFLRQKEEEESISTQLQLSQRSSAIAVQVIVQAICATGQLGGQMASISRPARDLSDAEMVAHEAFHRVWRTTLCAACAVSPEAEAW